MVMSYQFGKKGGKNVRTYWFNIFNYAVELCGYIKFYTMVA